MRVYLACTVRGSRGGLEAAREIARHLQALGHEVLTTHLLHDDVDQREGSLDECQVFTRDVAWLEECDALVAEASGSSYGVGFEVGYVSGRARRTGQRVFVLFEACRRPEVSRLAIGHAGPGSRVVPYETLADLHAFVETEFGGTGAGTEAVREAPSPRLDPGTHSASGPGAGAGPV